MWGFLTFLVAVSVRNDPVSVAQQQSHSSQCKVHTSQAAAQIAMTGYDWRQNCIVLLGFIYMNEQISIKCFHFQIIKLV